MHHSFFFTIRRIHFSVTVRVRYYGASAGRVGAWKDVELNNSCEMLTKLIYSVMQL